MDQIIQQVGAFLLGSIPTLILFILLVIAYQLLVQGPLTRTLRERRARTTGAMEEADKAVAAAEAKTADYENKLRQARAEIFRLREQRQQQWVLERESVLGATRKTATQHVLEAKVALDREAESARKTILTAGDELAEQVVHAILPAAAGGTR